VSIIIIASCNNISQIAVQTVNISKVLPTHFPRHKTKLSTRLEQHNKTPSHCPFMIMGNDLSSPNVHGTTPRVDVTSEFQKRRRRHRDWDKESLSSTQFLSELLEWDKDNDAAANATGPRVRQRAVKKYYFETIDQEGNQTMVKPSLTLWYLLYVRNPPVNNSRRMATS
jgi:hypothetical protein